MPLMSASGLRRTYVLGILTVRIVSLAKCVPSKRPASVELFA